LADTAGVARVDVIRGFERDTKVEGDNECVWHQRVWAFEVAADRFDVCECFGTLVAAERSVLLAVDSRHGRDLRQALAVDGERIQPAVGALADLQRGHAQDLLTHVIARRVHICGVWLMLPMCIRG
jgi:hypothetical protein